MNVIDVRPRHVPLGEGVTHEEYVVVCACGYYDKAGPAPTHAGRKRAATYLAMHHNHRRHYGNYKIQGGSS